MLVDSEFQIAAAVQAICRESEIAVDCEGVDLSRTGKLCLVQIGLQNGTVFIFDITVLGALAFEIRMNDGIETLKTLLESPRILKIIFDVRNDSEALFHQYNVALTNVMDIQLSELALRRCSGQKTQFLHGLKKVIEEHLDVDPTTMALKASLTRRFAASNGFDVQMWNHRPLQSEAIEYAAADARLLFPLHRKFLSQLKPKWINKVMQLSNDRLQERYLKNPTPNGPERAYAPSFN
jgi:exonuclease 3'-5' domain-containing protein 1